MIEVREINLPGQPNGRRVRRGGPVVALDYDVAAPARVFVRGPSFDTEWGLDVHIGGTLDALDLEGAATLQRGRASLLGRPFTLARGRVVFNGPPEAATLDIEAVREAREITARIVVSGTPQAPRIRLTSTPALPEDEVASRLLFDQGAGSLSGVQAAQLAGALASLTGAGFDPIGAVRAATGLDQLSVTTGRTGETVVSGGRYLAEDVYLELETAGGSAAPTTRIEWSLTNRLTLLSRLSGLGEADVALSWRMEYD
jgi:translocation and assembly module TamB